MVQASYIPPGATSSGVALSCPWCNNAGAAPSASPQSCARCGRRFTLSAGHALDPSIVPPPPHGATKITIRWSAVVTYRFATLDHGGILSGTLDPVVAMAPIDQVGVAFHDVASIAVWRKLAWSNLIVGVLVPLPLGLLLTISGMAIVLKATGTGLIVAMIGLGFLALGALLIYRGFVVGRRFARVVGRAQVFTIQFDSRPMFHHELFRRCGIVPPPLP